VTASTFVLTALNAWEWAALAGSSLVISAAALWTHRRDRRKFDTWKDHHR
jgi:hypothetical protein